MKEILIEKKEVEVFLFAPDMILLNQNSKDIIHRTI